MGSIAQFEKILTIRTTEKDIAMKEYQESVEDFETVALELYNLLKEKEEIEEELNNKFHSQVTVHEIQHYQNYLEMLEKQILVVNQKVQQAREKMEFKKQKLSDSYIEMKKFERIVDIKKREFLEHIAKLENDQMNEISIQQFLRTRKR